MYVLICRLHSIFRIVSNPMELNSIYPSCFNCDAATGPWVSCNETSSVIIHTHTIVENFEEVTVYSVGWWWWYMLYMGYVFNV